MQKRSRSRCTMLQTVASIWCIQATDSFIISRTVHQWMPQVLSRQYFANRAFARFDEDDSSESSSINNNLPTMNTALCVIPPDEAWDTIQRARHVARDKTYHIWPPAIRLFHPFCPRSELSNVAMDVAKVVEDYEIEPFQVVLDTWTILPHMEALEADLEAMQNLPLQDEKHETGEKPMTEVEKLIAREEQIGKERLRLGKRRLPKKLSSVRKTRKSQKDKQSPQELVEKQRRMYEEFNGPCVVCLEPNQESRERLVELRQLLRDELFEAYDKYSPSSSVSTSGSLPRAVTELEEATFRPLVPVGSFPTVTSAIEMARKLKGLWEPLSFNVTDFHLISHDDEDVRHQIEMEDFSDNREYNLRKISWMQDQAEEKSLTSQGQYGCDAMVMLMGEEMDIDEESSKEMVDLIMSQGSPGGYELPKEDSRDTILDKTSEDGFGDLEEWLGCDDEWDEGSVIILGRTQFFTGEMRNYVGMPASSVVDAQDRTASDIGGTSSGRRKRSPALKDGDFGRAEAGYVF